MQLTAKCEASTLPATVMVSFWSKASFSRMWMLLSWGLGLVLALTVRRLVAPAAWPLAKGLGYKVTIADH